MSSSRLCRLVLSLALLMASLLTTVDAQPIEKSQTSASPWGVSASASSFRNHAEWMPKMSAAGVRTVRLFPEWRGVEPKLGTFRWDDSDALVKHAAENQLEINAVLMGSPPGAKAVHAFPMNDLDAWAKFTTQTVARYKDNIRYWEVWNEGNGGFNDEHHTTVDYAKLAAVTYASAKKANPEAQVGLTVASFDPAYLQQTLRAMAKAGTPDRFDYLCIHPYEITDGLSETDGEIPFLWMTHTLRQMLKQESPKRADAEIWITELGAKLGRRGADEITEDDAARTLVKAYTMAIAQGVARIQWFEAQDPAGEEAGFGLIDRQGRERASYRALKHLSEALGETPKYQGWLALGREGRGYGFVFAGKEASVLVAWMPAKLSDNTLTFTDNLAMIDPLTGTPTALAAGEALKLTAAPIIVANLPAALTKQAIANAAKPFPWGGNFAQAKTVNLSPGDPASAAGIFQTNRAATPQVTFADGSTGILVPGDINHPVSFFVHPSLAGIETRDYYVRATVRRVAPGNVGMNCIYERADTQGGTPYVNVGQWFGATDGDGWQTHTWHVPDAALAKMWGFDFALRPEQSVPFVIGKVEISTEPLK